MAGFWGNWFGGSRDPRRAQQSSEGRRDQIPTGAVFDPMREFQFLVQAFQSNPRETQEQVNQKLERAGEAIGRLEHWRAGGSLDSLQQSRTPPFLTFGELRDAYHQQLWKLADGLRRAKQYELALRVWSLVRCTSDDLKPELVALAVQLPKALAGRESLRNNPARVEEAFFVAAETLHAMRAEVPPEIEAAVRSLFGFLRVDWERPVGSDKVEYVLRIMELLRPLATCLPTDLARNLTFWEAMGRWRLSARPDYVTLLEQFEVLLGTSPRENQHGEGVYWWCKARVCYESANGDATAALDALLTERRNPLAHESADVLGNYFGALAQAEYMLHLRESRLASIDWPATQVLGILQREPAALEQDRELQEHVKPILDRLKDGLRPSMMDARKVSVSGTQLIVRCRCGYSRELPNSWQGKKGRCPQCGRVLEIPR